MHKEKIEQLEYRFGQVVLANLPEKGKYVLHGTHPCVVLFQDRQTMTVVPISRCGRKPFTARDIPLSTKTGIKYPSYIKTGQIHTIDLSEIKNLTREVDIDEKTLLKLKALLESSFN